jgi:dTDP-4-amino-4,6-dideoxygalactose transaminase
VEARQKAASYYDRAFSGNSYFDIPYRDPSSTHVFHQYTIKLKQKNREDLKKYLESQGIPTMVYYPVPVHLQKAYSNLGYKKGDFTVAEKLSEVVISLPMHTELTEDQLNYITEKTLSYFK